MKSGFGVQKQSFLSLKFKKWQIKTRAFVSINPGEFPSLYPISKIALIKPLFRIKLKF
jgi:hypothetical protein